MKKDIILSNGVKIPNIGYGTWQVTNDIIYECFNLAIKCGYRHIDSAQAYGNEENLGKAIKTSSIKREDLFITSKVLDIHKSYESAKASIEESLKKLDTPYIDLMLIHCPQPWDIYGTPGCYDYKKENVEVWKALEEFYEAGKIKVIGVSNFSIEDIQNIFDNCKIRPMVNQIPVYIGKTNWELINYCLENNIAVEAYSPIAHGKILSNPVVKKMADKYRCTIAQLCIAYVLQIGLIALPKATSEEHMLNNIDINFSINETDLEYLKNLKLDIGW